MCSPLAVIGVGTALAGTLASNAGTMQARNAQDSAVANQIRLQGEHQQKEASLFNDSLQKSQPGTVEGNADARTAARLDALRAQGGLDAATSLTPDDQTSPATKGALKQFNDTNAGRLNTMAQGSATMGGLDDAFRTLGMETAPNASKIAEEANFGAGDASLLPIQLAEASRKGGGLRTFGSLMTGLGDAAVGGAATGAIGAGGVVPGAADAAASSGGIIPQIGNTLRSGLSYLKKPLF